VRATHPGPVQHAEQIAGGARHAQLAAEKQVVGNGERRRQSEILVHRLDSRRACVLRRGEVDDFTIEADLAMMGKEGAGQRLDQAGLARAIAPITARISPG
jgi:hypothetical protein